MPGTLLCPSCAARLEFIDLSLACRTCGAPFGALTCTECTDAQHDGSAGRGTPRFPFSEARAAISYAGVGKDLITAYKDGGERRLDETLAALLVKAVRGNAPTMPGAPAFMRHPVADWSNWADTLVAIPARRAAIRKRGFDHLLQVASHAAAWLDLPLVPALRHAHETLDQRVLGSEQRTQNLRGSFAVTDPSALAGTRIVLVDDVLTTGATTSAAAHALLAGGAAEVRVAVVARVW